VGEGFRGRGNQGGLEGPLPTWDFLINLPKPSARIIKRYRDRGSPCLIPLEDLKVVEGDPLTRITKKA
jgi:hypothetical protein